MATNRNCIDCPELGLPVGPQGPQGIAGLPGADGAAGADGADGANILYNPDDEVGTTNAIGPQTLRTFTITPSMIANNGDEILVSGFLTSFNQFPSPNGRISVTFGGAVIFTWLGINGNPLIAQEYYFEVAIRRDGDTDEFITGLGHDGVITLSGWSTKGSYGNYAIDLTTNQDLKLIVNAGGTVFQTDEIVSRNFKVTQLKIN